MEEVSVNLDCTGETLGVEGSRNEKAKLSFILSLGEEDKKQLLEGNTLNKNVYVELRQEEDGRRLWPSLLGEGKKFINVTREGRTQDLKVEIGKLEDVERRTGGGVRNGSEVTEKEFTCQGGGFVSTGDRKKIYEGKVNRDDRWNWPAWDTQALKMDVAVTKCEMVGERKIVTCDLKLTSGSDLNWSTKVSAKAKLTIN